MAEELLMSDSTVKASEKHFVFFAFFFFFFYNFGFRFKNFLLVIRCPLVFCFSIGKAHFRIII